MVFDIAKDEAKGKDESKGKKLKPKAGLVFDLVGTLSLVRLRSYVEFWEK